MDYRYYSSPHISPHIINTLLARCLFPYKPTKTLEYQAKLELIAKALSGAICEAMQNPSASDYVTVAFIQTHLKQSHKERNGNENKR